MNTTLVKAFVAAVPASVVLVGATVKFARQRRLVVVLQLLGAAGLIVVVLSHICEGLQLLVWMGWGHTDSIGHYVDVSGAIVGLTLFPVGYLMEAFTRTGRTESAHLR